MPRSHASSVNMDETVSIDLNLDAGESELDFKSGKEEALYQLVSSVNVACGGHAGTADTMKRAVDLALKYGLAIGAHPSYPDQENFGRKPLSMPRQELIESIRMQIESLKKVCAAAGTKLHHVKPHGALYNRAAVDAVTASVLLEAIGVFDNDLIVLGLAGSLLLDDCRKAGVKHAAEGFVDRRYEPDGTLRARQYEDALITDPNMAVEQALRFALGEDIVAVDGASLSLKAQTLCIHGDHQGETSLAIARAVRLALSVDGITVQSLRA